MDCYWAILLITVSYLYSLVSGETKNLCEQSSGTIYDDGRDSDEYDLNLDGCNSGPNALVLKFKTRTKYCSKPPLSLCSMKSKIKVGGDEIFDTCDMRPIDCYVFSSVEFPFSLLTEYKCQSAAVRIIDVMTTVRFEYKMCHYSSDLELEYTHVVKNLEPPSTTNKQTTKSITVTTKSAEMTTAPETSTLPKILKDTTFYLNPDVTPNSEFKSEQTEWTSSIPSKPLPQGNSMEKTLAIIFGVLLIISLLALGILAIRYYRVAKSQKAASPIDSQDDDTSRNNGEVIVNQIYDSVNNRKPGGQMVMNELYGMT